MDAVRQIQATVVWADMILCGLWRFGRLALCVALGVGIHRLLFPDWLR